ncbi:MAG TPA: hypothetical protein VMS17_26115 [Gemmataceae bacterium]|nr:hypothetical protein [Gemmataceae bacterium]
MAVVAPTEPLVVVLRAISRAGFAYTPTKALCEAAGWRLVDDEPDLGYVRSDMLLAAGSDERRPVSVLIAESNKPPFAFVPLFYFEEYHEGREPFDLAFRALAEQLAGFLGAATRSGVYSYPHRAGWSYSFAGWALADATLVLVQDEFDIQFGMDVTLWVQPAGAAVEAPVRYE